ncbi:MAG: type II toxin-antitoxin system VapC family toxin [Candidatus Igneacidithiobacillus chanchocoensis]
MRLLLDTHIALWTVYRSAKLSPIARSLLADPTAEVYCGVISLWEIAIKREKYPDQLPDAATARRDFLQAGIQYWPLHGEVFERLETLPQIHKDPFDRLLVAMAFAEPIRLVTADAVLAAYDAGGQLILTV